MDKEIFWLDKDPKISASYLNDNDVFFMPLSLCLVITYICRNYVGVQLGYPNEIFSYPAMSPSLAKTKWHLFKTKESFLSYFDYTSAIIDEYEYRFEEEHPVKDLFVEMQKALSTANLDKVSWLGHEPNSTRPTFVKTKFKVGFRLTEDLKTQICFNHYVTNWQDMVYTKRPSLKGKKLYEEPRKLAVAG